jgi:hypothetical protein
MGIEILHLLHQQTLIETTEMQTNTLVKKLYLKVQISFNSEIRQSGQHHLIHYIVTGRSDYRQGLDW